MFEYSDIQIVKRPSFRNDRVWRHIVLLTGRKVWLAGMTICATAPSRRVLSTETFPSFGTLRPMTREETGSMVRLPAMMPSS